MKQQRPMKRILAALLAAAMAFSALPALSEESGDRSGESRTVLVVVTEESSGVSGSRSEKAGEPSTGAKEDGASASCETGSAEGNTAGNEGADGTAGGEASGENASTGESGEAQPAAASDTTGQKESAGTAESAADGADPAKENEGTGSEETAGTTGSAGAGAVSPEDATGEEPACENNATGQGESLGATESAGAAESAAGDADPATENSETDPEDTTGSEETGDDPENIPLGGQASGENASTGESADAEPANESNAAGEASADAAGEASATETESTETEASAEATESAGADAVPAEGATGEESAAQTDTTETEASADTTGSAGADAVPAENAAGEESAVQNDTAETEASAEATESAGADAVPAEDAAGEASAVQNDTAETEASADTTGSAENAAGTEEASCPDPFEAAEASAEAPLSGDTSDGSGSANTPTGAGEITAVSLELVNGFATLRFTIDGRYEGILNGLSPDTTEEEALAMAEAAADRLYGESDSLDVADGQRYTGLEDSSGAYVDRMMNTTVAEYDEKLKTETDPETRAEIYEELFTAYNKMIFRAGDSACLDLLKQWRKDPENSELRAALDAAMAQKVSELEAAYNETRGYEDVNEVFEGQTALVDAEKTARESWFLPEEEQDSNLCWAAAAANMLWYTGWGAGAVNPQTGEPFQSQDELLSWFTEAFEDKGAKQNTAIQYLFKGITPDTGLTYASPREGYMDPESPYALLAQYCADMLVSVTEETNNPVAVAATLDSLETGAGVGLSAYTLSYSSGHALTAFGRIIDTEAADAASALMALFVADSDSDAPVLTEAEFNGALTEDGQQSRESRINAYTMLLTDIYTNSFTNRSAIRLVDYNGGMLVAGTTVLEAKTEETLAEVTETDPEATLNAVSTVDLIPQDVGVVSTDLVLSDTFNEGDALIAVLRVKNESETTLKGNQAIPVELTLFRLDGSTGEIAETAGTYAFEWNNALESNAKSCLFGDMGSDLAPGSYLLQLTGLNGDHTVTEAYYINNLTVDGYTFTVIALPVPKKASGEKKTSGVTVYRVSAVVLSPDEPAHIALAEADGKGGSVPFTVQTEGAVLYEAGGTVDPSLWRILTRGDGSLELVLSEAYLETLEPGEHILTLAAKDARVIFTLTVAPPLG